MRSESKTVESLPLCDFVKANLRNPTIVAEALLAGFSSPSSRVAFALDKLSDLEKKHLLEAKEFPLVLKLYYSTAEEANGLLAKTPLENVFRAALYGNEYFHDVPTLKDRDLLGEFNTFTKGLPPQLVHALKTQFAIHSAKFGYQSHYGMRFPAYVGDPAIYWALISHSKEHLNLAGYELNTFGFKREHYNLSGVNLKKATLKGMGSINFSDADLSEASIEGCSQSNFTAAILTKAKVRDCPGSTFQKAQLNNTKLVGSTFERSDFFGTDLRSIDEDSLFLMSSLLGADFRQSKLSQPLKNKIQSQLQHLDQLPAEFKPFKSHFKNKKYDNFDEYVYGLLLAEPQSKIDFIKKMNAVPSSLKIKLKVFTHPFWTAATQTVAQLSDVIVCPKESLSEKIAGVLGSWVYLPPDIHSQMISYSRQLMPHHVAKMIINIIKFTPFLHSSYALINRVNPSDFIPHRDLEPLILSPVTQVAIQHELICFANRQQITYKPQAIRQAIEAIKAIFYLNTLNERPTERIESKEPVSSLSSSTSKIETLMESSVGWVNQEIFATMDARIRAGLKLHFTFLKSQQRLAEYGKRINIDAEEQESMKKSAHSLMGSVLLGCAELLMTVWRNKESMVETLSQAPKLTLEAKNYGYECKELKGEGNGFFDAIKDQLKDDIKLTAFQTTLITEIANSMTEKLTQLFIENQESLHPMGTLSKYLYHPDIDAMVMTAATKVLNVNIALLNGDGTPPLFYQQSAPSGNFCLGYDGQRYHSLHMNPELKAVKLLAPPSLTREIKDELSITVGLFGDSTKSVSSTSVSSSSLSSMPRKTA